MPIRRLMDKEAVVHILGHVEIKKQKVIYSGKKIKLKSGLFFSTAALCQTNLICKFFRKFPVLMKERKWENILYQAKYAFLYKRPRPIIMNTQ